MDFTHDYQYLSRNGTNTVRSAPTQSISLPTGLSNSAHTTRSAPTRSISLPNGSLRQFIQSLNTPKAPMPNQNSYLNVNPSRVTNTLFVGDLSVVCDEAQMFDLFSPFGPIESIQLKRNELDPQKTHLGYGFVKYASVSDAGNALIHLNGVLFLGRRLRVGWAGEYPRSQTTGRLSQEEMVIGHNTNTPKINQTAQVHFTFVSGKYLVPVTENDLRQIFVGYGEVVDVVIKKNIVNQEARILSGYGFVHFPMTEEGIHSALRANDGVNRIKRFGEISIECSLTHGLKTYLLSVRTRKMESGLMTDNGRNAFESPRVQDASNSNRLGNYYSRPPSTSISPLTFGDGSNLPYYSSSSISNGDFDPIPETGDQFGLSIF